MITDLKLKPFCTAFEGREITHIRAWLGVLEVHFKDSWVEFYSPTHTLKNIKIPKCTSPMMFKSMDVHLNNILLSMPFRVYVLDVGGTVIVFESHSDIKYIERHHTVPQSKAISCFVDVTLRTGDVVSDFDIYKRQLHDIYAICSDIILKLEHHIPLIESDVRYIKQLFECLDFFKKREEFLSLHSDLIQERLLALL